MGVGVGVAVGVGVGVGVGVAVGVGVGVGVGSGDVAPLSAAINAGISTPGSVPFVARPLYGLSDDNARSKPLAPTNPI